MEIKRVNKYIINGQEYNSLEEVPENLRGLTQGAVNLKSGIQFKADFNFNGKRYNSVDDMPADIRKLFEDKNKNGVPDILEDGAAEKVAPRAGGIIVVRTDSTGKGWLIGFVLVVIGMILYWLSK